MSDCCAPWALGGRSTGRWIVGTASVCLWLLGAATACRAEAEDPRLEPTSESYAQDEARSAIPWNKLSPQEQRVVRYVVSNASLYRRLPTRVEPCNPEVFDFLARRPEVVTGIWNLMGVSNLTLERQSQQVLQASDKRGGKGRFEILHTERDADARGLSIAVVNGVYHQKPMPRPLKAQCVMLLRSGSTVETNGQTYVTARLDAFIKFERAAADLVARGLAPLVVRTADHNFTETMKFVSTFSKTAETNPAGMRRLADKLTQLDAPARAEMMNICQRAHARVETHATARRLEAARLAKLRTSSAPN